MNLSHLKTITELAAFLEGSQAVAYSLPTDKNSRYAFIQSALKQFHYRALSKADKGVAVGRPEKLVSHKGTGTATALSLMKRLIMSPRSMSIPLREIVGPEAG